MERYIAEDIIEREMDDKRKDNVMPVEVAIQRELAYRKKVQMLQLKPYGADSWKEFLPLQEPRPSSSLNLESWPCPSSSPRPNLAGIKRKTPSSSSLQCLPPQQLQPTASSHTLRTQSDNLCCKVCQVVCSGAHNFKQHLRGRQHKAKLQESRLSMEDGREKAKQLQWCELCKISCMDKYAFKLHLRGHKHKAKLQELELGRTDEGGKANQRQFCKLCNIWCMDETAFKQHIEGKKHIVRFHAIGEKMRAEEDNAAAANLDLKHLEWHTIS